MSGRGSVESEGALRVREREWIGGESVVGWVGGEGVDSTLNL